MPYTDHNIQAKVIAGSVNKFGTKLTTFVATYPRIILAEVNTHRMLSRSTASSRAIPIDKQVSKVMNNPFIPSWCGVAQSGMQANIELSEENQERFKQQWLLQAFSVCESMQTFQRIGVHKQIANRLLEPWGYVTSIITATDLNNFFKLRCHKDSQPEFMVLAFKMLEAYLNFNHEETDLHIPFGDKMDPGLTTEEKILVACARCARISYETHDGNRDHKEDMKLAERLISSGHMSPFEHVAHAHAFDVYVGNFKGWVQERKKIAGENCVKIDLKKLLEEKPYWI